MDKDLNVRPETIELLEENMSRTLSDINHNKILYDPPPKVMEIKTKINKWDLIQLKNLHNEWNYAAAAAAKSFQSCLILCEPIDGNP